MPRKKVADEPPFKLTIMLVIMSLDLQNHPGDPMSRPIKPNLPDPHSSQPASQSIPLDRVAGSGNESDVELKVEVPRKWRQTTCCGKTFYVDPDGGVLREKNGDPSSAMHYHENAEGIDIEVHEGEERKSTGLRRKHRENA